MTSHYITLLARELQYVEWGRGNPSRPRMRCASAAQERVVGIAGCGHAPALNVPGQIGLIEEFLAE